MKKPRKAQNGQSLIDSLDRSANHCLNIMAVAELLRCCNMDYLKPEIVKDIGQLLFAEAEKLMKDLDAISPRQKR